MSPSSLPKNDCRGFSLIELLTTIAVIGVIAAIALPNIGYSKDAAKSVTGMRNAQNIVMVFSTGAAAGIDWDGSTVDELVASVMKGGTPTSGPFKDQMFRVQGITVSDLTAAKAHLQLSGGRELLYRH